MKTLILGFDSFDPKVFEELVRQNQLPNFQKFVEQDGYSQLKVCSPPQTEVSWTSMATGADPGGHGIFDFVHRDPATYVPYVSILPMRKGPLGEQFVPPYTARTFFEEAASMGYPATALWWPAMFPARPELPVNTLPGLGTPDIRGQLGVGTLFTSEDEKKKKTVVVKLTPAGRHLYKADLPGPQTKGKDGPRTISLPLEVEVIDSQMARVTIGDQRIELKLGVWSEIIEMRFKAGMLFNIHAITRLIATSLENTVRIYSLPLQIHPLHSTWNYAGSNSFSKKLWKDVGPYLTLGWPQDTTGLEESIITDEQFLNLCQMIFERRIQILYYLMDDFKEGVLASIFDDLDRVQHMFFHNRMDVVHDWYRRLDRFVGDVTQKVEQWSGKYRYLLLSDHGFSDFRKKVHLNRWLVEHDYLCLKNGGERSELAWTGQRRGRMLWA